MEGYGQGYINPTILQQVLSFQNVWIDVTENKDGGVTKLILNPGTGDRAPSIGDKVTVHYIGMFDDGTVFDSSRQRGEEFKFDLGRGRVILGWDLGVSSMRKGEISRLKCQPGYAYGRAGNPPKIPGNATLIFEIEVLSWHGEDMTDTEDGGVIKNVLVWPRAWDTPNDGATVKIHLLGRHKDRVFEDREINFIMGEGVQENLLASIEKAVKRFRRTEKSRLIIQPKYGYGEKGNSELHIPPNAELVYEVHLISFERAKDSWELDDEEKVEQSEIYKEKGTKYFKEGKFKQAEKFYEKIVNYLEYATTLSGEKKDARNRLILAAYLNLAFVYLKIENFDKCVLYCNKALKMDPQSEKAFFRRGMAYLNVNNPDVARKDFQNVLTISPNNKAAKNMITRCSQELRKEGEAQKQLYKSMMSDVGKGISNKEGVVASEGSAWGQAQSFYEGTIDQEID